MRVCLIALSLWLIATGGSQAPNAALPAALRTRVQDDRFDVVASIRGLPLGVRDALQVLFGSQTLDIAEPHGDFQASGMIVDAMVPTRRLAAAGCSTNHYCLVYYQRRGNDPTWHVALFHWTPAATRFEWGGVAPPNLATLADVRKVILSGGIKAPMMVW
jgi:hypothetical protein